MGHKRDIKERFGYKMFRFPGSGSLQFRKLLNLEFLVEDFGIFIPLELHKFRNDGKA